CGLPNRENRVLGGIVTDKVEYPWLAYLTYRGKLYCGGSVINDRYLVTAGHCIHRVNKDKVIVHLGKHKRLSSADPSKEYKVKNWHMHPEFNRRTFQNDIGVIELEKPIELSTFLRPICLPTQDGQHEGEFGTVVGWGRTTERGSSSNFPREIKVPIISNSKCKSQKYKPKEITNNMFCAGYDQGKIDACQVSTKWKTRAKGLIYSNKKYIKKCYSSCSLSRDRICSWGSSYNIIIGTFELLFKYFYNVNLEVFDSFYTYPKNIYIRFFMSLLLCTERYICMLKLHHIYFLN
ncbi:UNVERIFIED_CONTAM: hypothetical protein GTU68_010597, partial [Idotea baltica]|nr:hypothetical protein [Idotea baltica]